ncbi:HD domain-containing protein [Pseudoalteromonas sp. NEC-BIFX-2020_002]|uniref:HD domain-containing protein n=1 Tax=unclassified Pseudoalteromonas TaxID=194690 RepID=UPI0014613867|nr:MULTISPECIES: HD domain-containing protein [unclassified Pseudoalteromonas]NMR25171.1 HD domain-containing protein [Pseudoalteromonas sp. NEC-BIFX-2020_015]NNG42382.1 HD domain-containing protein [Pseudoalteromonas sp. NEC-BIFX-2020_002]
MNQEIPLPVSLQQLEIACKGFITEVVCADVAHDITHIERVVRVAKQLCIAEQANMAVVLPAAWLHDCVAVAKNHPDRAKASTMAADKAISFLASIGYDQQFFAAIHHAIVAHSFSANIQIQSVEAQIVQDADRMDALGAIGVSRCMKVGGSISRHLYHPQDPFCQQRKADDTLYTLDHFFIKLLHIAKSMNTPSAKTEAKRRTDYMLAFIEQLKSEVGKEL